MKLGHGPDWMKGQFQLFLAVGAFCFAISIVLLYIAVDVMDIEVNLSNLVVSLIVIYIAYLLNRRYVFKSGKYGFKKEISLFYIFSFVGLGLNLVMMYLMTAYLPISYLIDKTVTTGAVAAFNFFTRKWIVFQS